ncbi:MAG: hypothetical protein LCI00_16925 [Chloroflexi bacterium]|nr:hypothetical protein [Chloroflexota bacterium]
MDYEQMSIEALEAENIRLSSERAAIQQEQRTINEVLSRKIASLSVQAKIASFSAAEIAALAQHVGVDVAQVSSEVLGDGE